MRTPKILKGLLFLIGFALLTVSVINSFDFGINLPDFITGASGLGLAGMSFGSVTLPSNGTGYQDGDENMGGFGIIAYLALHGDISSWPLEYTDPDTLEKMVKLHGNFGMVAQKYFLKVYLPPDVIDFSPEGQGDPGGRSFKLKGEFFVPGMDGENRGMARRFNNSRGVLIIPTDDGYRLCLGSETRPVSFMPSGKSGKKAADQKGFTYAFDADSFAPGFTYNGSIPLSGSTLPAVS